MTVTIGRREVLAALGGAAVAWPVAARAGRGTGATASEASDHRLSGDCSGFGLGPMDCRFRAATARTRLDRGTHRRDPISLGGRTHGSLFCAKPKRASPLDYGRSAVKSESGECITIYNANVSSAAPPSACSKVTATSAKLSRSTAATLPNSSPDISSAASAA